MTIHKIIKKRQIVMMEWERKSKYTGNFIVIAIYKLKEVYVIYGKH